MAAARSEIATVSTDTANIPRSYWLIVGAAVIAIITAIAYIPSMRGGFIWDDDDYIVNRTVVHDWGGLDDIWLTPKATPQYYPMVFTTFWIEHKIWGLDPTGYHIVNVALHIASSILLWFVLRRLGLRDGVAWVAAAVFAVHPVHVESVAWVTERKNVLSGLLYLASLYVAIDVFGLGREKTLSVVESTATGRKSRQAAPPAASPSPLGMIGRYLLMLALFSGALLSKTVTCSLPAALILLIWWKRGRISQLQILAMIPMFVIGIALALHTVEVEKNHVGVEVLELNYSFLERCMIAGRAIWFYAGKLVWPHPIVFIYPRWHVRAEFTWMLLYPAAVLAVIVALWCMRKRLGRGPLVAVLIFCGTLVPALGFIDVFPMVYSFVADHFQYLASISFITLIVAAAATAFKRTPAIGVVVASIVILALSALTWREGAKYKDLIALWTDTVTKNPRAAMAHINLGNELNLRDTPEAWEAARQHYLAALNPEDPAIDALVRSKAHYGMGKYWLEMRDYLAALEQFRAAIQLKPTQPMAYYGEGITLASMGKADEALASYNRALQLNPNLAAAIEARQRILDFKKAQTPRQP